MTERETSACARPELAALIARYEHDLLDADERRRLEDHLLECDTCFSELERGARVAGALRDHAPALLRALNRGRAEAGVETVVEAGVEAAVEAGVETGVETGPRLHPLRGFAQTLVAGLRRPAVLAPVLAAAVVAVVLLRPHPGRPDITQWASFPTDVAVSTEVRGEEVRDVDVRGEEVPDTPAAALDQLLAAGRGHIAAGNYASAERFLRAAREREPESPEAAWLYGLALALNGAPERAIAPLELAATSPDSAARAMALWVLANCHLKLGQAEQAARRLEEVRAGGGEYAGEAARVLELIH